MTTHTGIENLRLKDLSHLGYTRTLTGVKIEALTTKKVSYVEIVSKESEANEIIEKIIRNN